MAKVIPPELVEVALVCAKTAAASADMSLSKWYDGVREGTAPQPVIRQHRYTRWRLADIRQWLLDRASSAPASVEVKATSLRALHASKSAAKKRDLERQFNKRHPLR